MRTGVGSITFPDRGRIRGHNVIFHKKTVDFRNTLISFVFFGQLNPSFSEIDYAYMIG